MAVPVCRSFGFSKPLFGVLDLEGWVSFFETTFQGVVLHSEPKGVVTDSLWHIPDSVGAETAIVKDPSAETNLGANRPVHFSNTEQQKARPNAAWNDARYVVQ